MEFNDESEQLEAEPLEIPKKQVEKKLSFFQRIFGFIFNATDAEHERKRLLREISKLLKRQKYKFFRIRTEVMEPAFARYFFEFYKLLGPAQSLVKHADYSGALRQIIIEESLPKDILEIRERLTEASIRARAEKIPVRELSTQIKDELIGFMSAFDIDKVRIINHTYSLLTSFVDLIHFDYFFLLKKFDAGMPEGNFFYTPHFDATNGEYITDEMKDFLEIIALIEETEDWNKILDILKEYRGVDVVPRAGWKKVLGRIRELRRSRILLHIVQYLEKDPYYKIKAMPKSEKIVESYLSKLKTQTELTIQKIIKEKHMSKVDELTNLVFGTSSISRLKNYTEKSNAQFSKRMLGGYIFVQPLNYLKAFLLDYLKKDIRETIDLFLIKGKWTSNIISQQISDAFHELIQISDRITEFDNSVSEETQTGAKFRSYLHKADKDKTAQKVLRQMLKEVNDMARGLIHEAGQHLITIGKNLKLIIDDYSRAPHELIINWKEIEASTDKNLQEFMVGVYKKLYYIVKLLQVYAKEG
ncbi:MAG: hypothetical protein JW904_06625 [Spirochaetales bacterium]|nr:hypothetical protein [Spirochaetales bacterium]